MSFISRQKIPIDADSDLLTGTKRRATAQALPIIDVLHAGRETAPGETQSIKGEQDTGHGEAAGAQAPDSTKAAAKDPAWKAPLSKAFSAVSDIVRTGQSEDFLPPPEMQGVIPRPQPISYQPIPYQPPILRRY